MAKIKWHKCGAYPFARYGIIYGSEDMRAFCEKNGLDFSQEPASIGVTIRLGHQILVYIDYAESTEIALSTLVHESVHVWQMITEAAGEAGHSVEAEAYGIQQVFDDLLSDIQRISQ